MGARGAERGEGYLKNNAKENLFTVKNKEHYLHLHGNSLSLLRFEKAKMFALSVNGLLFQCCFWWSRYTNCFRGFQFINTQKHRVKEKIRKGKQEKEKKISKQLSPRHDIVPCCQQLFRQKELKDKVLL